MNLRYLETFLWIVRLGSFSAAAKRMSTTQAAVSHRIQALEAEIGLRLFDRDSRSARLTADGHRIVPQVEDMLRLAHHMRDPGASAKNLRGTISIGTIDSIVYTWLPRFIEKLRERYPQVSLDLTVETSLSLVRPVQDGLIDLGLMMGPVIGSSMRNEEICTYACAWLASTSLDLPDGPLDLPDLAAYPLLAYPRNSIPHQALMQLLHDAHLQPDRVRIYNTNSIATLVRLVRDGIGVCAMPAAIMRDAIERGEVRCLKVRPVIPPLTFHAIYRVRPDNPLPQAVAMLAHETARDFQLETDKDFLSKLID